MRVLLAIGCDDYDTESKLGGAELDAQRVFTALMRPEIGDYDPTRSELLRSPTLDEIRAAVRRVLFAPGDIDTFTFFFAGHGAVESGSFYMLPKDSPARGLSMGALSLADLFRWISEAAPAQSNIVIDACEAGGLIADLGVLLKSDLIGDSGTPGVTLVATAAQDQTAGETDDGGYGATALLDIIEGRDVINDTAPAFDLVEIGRRISTRLREEADQTPVVWGFNLYGPPRFCRNVHAGADPSQPLRAVLQAWPTSSEDNGRNRFEELWRVYSTIGDQWRPRPFAQTLAPILASVASDPNAQAAVIERLSAACLERARLSSDVFRPAQVGAALLVCLLPYLQATPVARQAEALMGEIGEALVNAGAELIDALDADPAALLSRRWSGIPDLFLLPMRLSNVLGWIAAAPLMFSSSSPRIAVAKDQFADLLTRLIEHYSTSLVTLSDGQAAPLALALGQAIAHGLTDQAETLCSLLFSDLVGRKARLARDDIPDDAIFDFLRARGKGDYPASQEWVARPDALTAVVLLAGARLGLNDVFDDVLWELDGHIFFTYVPDGYASFGDLQILSGDNLVWTIGQTVFRITDLDLASAGDVAPPSDPATLAVAVLASLTYPDRVAWFALAGVEHAASETPA